MLFRSGINAWDVIKFSNKHPRVNLHQPGPGVGGHCLAVDPWFIVEKNPDLAKIIKLSRETNESMPEYVFEKIKHILGGLEGANTVTILGVTYKPNIDDMRESPITEIVGLLEKEGVNVKIYDPHVEMENHQYDSIGQAASGSDLLVLAVNHDIFKQLPLGEISKAMKNKNILDTRNFLDEKRIKDEGFNYYLLGKGE